MQDGKRQDVSFEGSRELRSFKLIPAPNAAVASDSSLLFYLFGLFLYVPELFVRGRVGYDSRKRRTSGRLWKACLGF